MGILEHLLGKGKEEVDASGESFMLVGLGNPGRMYRETRHNIGFLVLDKFAEEHGIKFSKVQNKAITGTGKCEGKKVLLVKPQTYMNLSGQAVSSLVRYYRIPLSNLIVVHDEVGLPFGAIRMRPGGGSAGQKGVASIIEKMGIQNFPRLRMGIGRPPGRMEAADYVLQRFSATDTEFLPEFLDRAVEALVCYMNHGLESAMNRYNFIEPRK